MRFCLTLLGVIFLLKAAGQDADLLRYMSANAREIKCDTTDYKRLAFLDTLLVNRRIVVLGESSHGTEEYSQTKLQLIKYLHNRLGFNVVLFESPMTPGSYFNLAGNTATADELTKNSLQVVWHTKTVSKLFGYMKENHMSFGGFDPQFIPSIFPARLYHYAFSNYPDIETDLIRLEKRIAETFKTAGPGIKLQDSISVAWRRLAARLGQLQLSPLQAWIKHVSEINSDYYNHLNRGNERDSCMAKNLIWLAENAYPDQKIIVWAHNAHVDKNATSQVRFMGKLLAEHFGRQMYVVGFYMINGSTALNDRTIITVKTPAKNSLEGILGKSGFKIAFTETKDESFNREISTFRWGKTIQKLNLFKSYDAVILINGVSAPVYLAE